MLGRGVKRKRSCLEALEAESLHPAAEKTNGEEEREDEGGLPAGPPSSDMNRSQQRQLVLGLCLEKLQHYQAGVELSLRRSVLLVNTLRQIQEDMRSDGVGTCTPEALLGGVHADSRRLGDGMLQVTCPGCAEDDGDRLSPSSPGSSSQEGNAPPDQQKSPAAATINAFGDAVSTVGYLSDLALDDIFEDIDTSMYETSDLPSVWAAGSLWPVSVSLRADEDVKMRPSGHASAGSLQSCLMDLNELDHIMEILVKS